MEIRGPAPEAARVRAWILARSGSLDGDGVTFTDLADDPTMPGWTRCRMTVAPAGD
ncbi:hypothetical protein [Streptomyces abikoensis]|uniref:Uncharacterized protein n=1 Tax=Streptomyces abikoensis TaxID=97398 RepID=A0ABW7TCK0_9ACTN